jgi:hypothetical protein
MIVKVKVGELLPGDFLVESSETVISVEASDNPNYPLLTASRCRSVHADMGFRVERADVEEKS